VSEVTYKGQNSADTNAVISGAHADLNQASVCASKVEQAAELGATVASRRPQRLSGLLPGDRDSPSDRHCSGRKTTAGLQGRIVDHRQNC
jgi:hypothetical protein